MASTENENFEIIWQDKTSKAEETGAASSEVSFHERTHHFNPHSNLNQIRKNQMHKFNKMQEGKRQQIPQIPVKFNLVNNDSMYQTTPEETTRLNQTSRSIMTKDVTNGTQEEQNPQLDAERMKIVDDKVNSEREDL